MRRALVVGLEQLCGLLDHVTHRHGCVFARWSDQLDQRWRTDVWQPVDGAE